MTAADDLATAKAALGSAQALIDDADTKGNAAMVAWHNARASLDTAVSNANVAIAAAIAGLPAPSQPPPTTQPPVQPPVQPPTQAGTGPTGLTGNWKLALADEFTGTTVDTNKWNTSGSFEADSGRGNKGNGEQDWKTVPPSPNYQFDGNRLTIVARRDSSVHSGYAWTSGCLVSKAAFQEAFIELQCQQPNVKGMCAAFWTWGAPGTNVAAQEVDVFECYSDRTTHIVCTNHASGGGGTGFIQPDGDLKAGMHVYGADIRANGIDWYFDGKKIGSTSGHPTQQWNVIIYGTVNAASRAPEPDASTNEIRFPVDYCRVWQRA